jgi:hypothetical protein
MILVIEAGPFFESNLAGDWSVQENFQGVSAGKGGI